MYDPNGLIEAGRRIDDERKAMCAMPVVLMDSTGWVYAGHAKIAAAERDAVARIKRSTTPLTLYVVMCGVVVGRHGRRPAVVKDARCAAFDTRTDGQVAS